ncbi:MAG: hypothetical protein GX941_07255 [Candidatus Methanofastidiosa archaeon]|jgi:hypothetical protein|nr:hypothetical protein [Candidatus Methanofastidiosa archaeon]HRS25289.1 hypothetical protein [Methanofastidiosum sp.]
MNEYVFTIVKTINSETLEKSIEKLLSEPIKIDDIKNFYKITEEHNISRDIIKCNNCDYKGHFGILHINMDKFPEGNERYITTYICPKCLSLERMY